MVPILTQYQDRRINVTSLSNKNSSGKHEIESVLVIERKVEKAPVCLHKTVKRYHTVLAALFQ